MSLTLVKTKKTSYSLTEAFKEGIFNDKMVEDQIPQPSSYSEMVKAIDSQFYMFEFSDSKCYYWWRTNNNTYFCPKSQVHNFYPTFISCYENFPVIKKGKVIGYVASTYIIEEIQKNKRTVTLLKDEDCYDYFMSKRGNQYVKTYFDMCLFEGLVNLNKLKKQIREGSIC